ncbi:hypothetical protein L211DRAFT_845028 [Terfezia boudieri ATCC MYA-4762]|uniref:AAA+ ATPase domain-containing protein n=1 Tax=Terfezia boudieri ATCC MYA-4762 TaxID=1051890 RepID=A0A3N4M1G0_9PEZI|nr:hypothetical protein L211DRAFT_845028 [Terfezia boudieri ATCC MYA-4762]
MTDTSNDQLDDNLDLALLDSDLDILDEEELLLLAATDDNGDPEYPAESDFEDDILLLLAAEEEEAKLVEEEEGFEDELEAIEELKKEQKEKWDREGVVIRGNSLGKRDLGLVIGQDNIRRKVRRERNQRRYLRQRRREVSRSSSLPPDSPTPARFGAFERRNSALNSSIVIPPSSSPRGSQPRKSVSAIELVDEQEEEEYWAQKATPKLSRANSARTLSETIHSVTTTEMDMDIDVPESTMLEYPSSPPPPAPSIPSSEPMQKRGALPFAYEEDESDDDDTVTGVGRGKGKGMGTILGDPKWIEVPSATAGVGLAKKRKAGPFEEVDEEDDDEYEEQQTVRLDKGKCRATDMDNFDPTLVITRDTLSKLNSQLNRPLSYTKPTLRSSKSLPFSYDDPNIPAPEFSASKVASFMTDSHFTYGYGRPGPNTVPVLLMSGKKLHIKRKLPKRQIYSTRTYTSEVTYDTDGNRELRDSYYGVEIHRLLDEIQAENKIAQYAKEKEAEQSGMVQTDSFPALPKLLIAGRQQRTLLWTEKYRAKRFTDLLGDERTHRQVLRWLKHWDDIVFPGSTNNTNKRKNKDDNEGYFHKKILLITGPPGLGKTTLAHVAARQAGYEPLEINASDDRTANVVRGKIRDALSNEGVRIPGVGKKKAIGSSRPVCVVVDEIDGVSGGGGETGFMNALVDLIMQDKKNSATPRMGSTSTTKQRKGKKGDNFKFHRPIIAICNDLYAPSLRALRPLAEIVYMKKPPTGLMVQRLRWVFEKEGVPYEDAAVRRLVELSTSGSAAQAASGGGGGGDMRGCLVSGEWLAKRLSITTSTTTTLTSGVCAKLTRKLVEEELEGRADSNGASRGGVRGCVERIFRKGDIVNTKGAARGTAKLSATESRRRELENLREEVQRCGEFDKIMTDVFGTYLTRPYHDDTRLSKPNLAYEWLWFHDLISSRVFSEQEFELMGYLAVPSMAFNTLFGTSSVTAGHGAFLTSATKMGGAAGVEEDDSESLPFQGPKADWDYREGVKATKHIVQSIQSNILILPGSLGEYNSISRAAADEPNHASPMAIRRASEFHSVTTLVTELTPYLVRIISPRVTPIFIHGGGGSGGGTSGQWGSVPVAFVRKESERRLVRRAVEVLFSTNISFEKVRVEFSSPTSYTSAAPTVGGWAYRMNPALDQLATFPTLTLAAAGGEVAVPVPTRYAVRQVLSQELHKYSVLQRQAAREARVAKLGLDAATLAPKMGKMKVDDRKNTAITTTGFGKSLKRDFFGRVIEEKCALNSGVVGGEEDGSEVKRRRKDEDEKGKKGKVWVSFHEGFSNAVKKGITLEDLLRGLY